MYVQSLLSDVITAKTDGMELFTKDFTEKKCPQQVVCLFCA